MNYRGIPKDKVQHFINTERYKQIKNTLEKGEWYTVQRTNGLIMKVKYAINYKERFLFVFNKGASSAILNHKEIRLNISNTKTPFYFNPNE